MALTSLITLTHRRIHITGPSIYDHSFLDLIRTIGNCTSKFDSCPSNPVGVCYTASNFRSYHQQRVAVIVPMAEETPIEQGIASTPTQLLSDITLDEGAVDPPSGPADREEQDHDESGDPLTGEQSLEDLDKDDTEPRRLQSACLTRGGRRKSVTSVEETLPSSERYSEDSKREDEEPDSNERSPLPSETPNEVGDRAQTRPEIPKKREPPYKDPSTRDDPPADVWDPRSHKETQRRIGNRASAGPKPATATEGRLKDSKKGDATAKSVKSSPPPKETTGRSGGKAHPGPEPPKAPQCLHKDSETRGVKSKSVGIVPPTGKTKAEHEVKAKAPSTDPALSDSGTGRSRLIRPTQYERPSLLPKRVPFDPKTFKGWVAPRQKKSS